MAARTVNLDALIRREDFAVDADNPTGSLVDRIDIHHLDDHFFCNALRKPDFQRETSYWTPDKVADLVQAFIDGDLIPAVILWQRGKDVFVIDGAHRLSALIAWVRNDYGDGKDSAEFFGGKDAIPLEQKKSRIASENESIKTLVHMRNIRAPKKPRILVRKCNDVFLISLLIRSSHNGLRLRMPR